MTMKTAIGLLADSVRLRVFSAVVLGATTPPDVANAAGTGPRETASALWRLKAGGLVEEVDGQLHALTENLRGMVREAHHAARPAENFGTGDHQAEALLRNFIQDGRLIHLPGQLGRRREVLRYLALRSFEPGRRYPELAVNDALRIWSERARTDHVALRRYLIELKLLDREAGLYWLRDDIWADFHV
ncbi:DUF2087 domain-containing protein [Streptomyces sioyaensis]|uniref:DUF2087 domain-containing protein n=1 Tax=Streptomyces sioyaensis TaxID=67364 RepID=UPI0036E7C313